MPVLVVAEHVLVVGDFAFLVIVGQILEQVLLILIFILIDQVVREVGLADLEGGVVALRSVVDIDVGDDALGLNRAARRRVVACCRELHGDGLAALA